MTALKIHSSPTVDIYSAQTETELDIPVLQGISAGFPSPAGDFIDQSIDLNRHLIKHPSATFFGRVKGESMKDAGINEGDLLVIDKSLEPANGKIAVCFMDGEFTLKRIKKDKEGLWLLPANEAFNPIHVTEENDLRIWGVVTYVIKNV
jgi:DNA polymerase V